MIVIDDDVRQPPQAALPLGDRPEAPRRALPLHRRRRLPGLPRLAGWKLGRTPTLLAAGTVLAILCVVVVAAAVARPGPAPTPHHPSRIAAGRPTPTTTSALPPPTTAVPRPALVATSTGPTSATYTATAASIQVSLAATRPCWVELRSGSRSGPVVFAGLLTAGASHRFDDLPGLWATFGYPPGASMQVDGTPVTLSGNGPFDVTITTGGG